VPAGASSSGVALPGNNRADRDLVATDTPENLNIFGLAKSPFGRGKIGSDNWAVRNILGGWQTAGVFTYFSGNPILVTGSGCTTPSSGTCMPDLVPNRTKDSIRTGGGFGGPGVTYANYTKKAYIDPTAFSQLNYYPLPAASTATPITKIGDAPRSDLNLWSPSHYDLDMALQRSFDVTKERVKFVFRADCFDVTNKVTFSMAQTQTVAAEFKVPNAQGALVQAQPGTPSPSQTATSSPNTGFGFLNGESGNRRFQFSGRVTF